MTILASSMFDVLMRTTVALSIAACLGWFLLKLFRARAARTHRIVWGAVLIQGWMFWNVLLPILPADESPADLRSRPSTMALTSDIGSRDPFAPIVFDARDETQPRVEPSTAHPVAISDSPSAEESSLIPTSLVAFVIGVWGCGIVVIVWRFSMRYLTFLRGLTDARQAPAEWSQEWMTTLVDAGVKADIPMLLHPAGPLLCRVPGGYRLLVPAEQWSALSSSRRRTILLHEIAHYRRGDVWKSLTARLLLLPHWFNPFAWLAVRRFDECAEWACDDAVCRQQSRLITEYARTLLDMTGGEHAAMAYSPGAGGRCLADRIRRLFNPVSKEDFLMKRISLFTLVSALSLLGLIRIGTAAAEPPRESAFDLTSATASKPTAADTSAQVEPKGDVAAATPPAVRNVQRGKSSQREFKIDEAVIDLREIFKKLPEFKRGREKLQKELKLADRDLQRALDDFRKVQAKGKKDDSVARDHYFKMRALHRKKLLQKEAVLYQSAYAKIQAAVARYAKEKDIRTVRRLKSPIPNNPRPSSSRDILQKINQEIIYQADERIDITKDILKRLIDADRRQSAKPSDDDPFAN